jgi:hypothetical protein
VIKPEEESSLRVLEVQKQACENERLFAASHWPGGESFYRSASLAEILRAHILSADGLTLIPVWLLCQSEKQKYSPYGEADEYEVINAFEWQRLYELNDDTQRLRELIQQYKDIEADKSHLLGMLTELCDVLDFADAHTGAGQPDAVGVQAYPALTSLKKFYDSLDEPQKAKIPVELRKEIEHTLALAFDPSFNREHATKVEFVSSKEFK